MTESKSKYCVEVPNQIGPNLKNASMMTVEGYCLNYALRPPDAGMLFRIAPPAIQARYASARSVLQAAMLLERVGQLRPDTDPKIYLESIKQYALWTKLENWDQKRFADAWVDTTRKQLAALKRQWTREMEATLRAAAPARWKDIRTIVALADSVQ